MDGTEIGYRVMSRRSALFILLLILLLGGLAVLASQQVATAWLVEFQARLDADPARAAAWLHERLFWFFVLSPMLLTVAALLVVWQGVRTLQTGFSPPSGAWIVHGQRTHAGRAARVRGHLQWSLGLILMAVAWGGCWYAYRLVEALLAPLLTG